MKISYLFALLMMLVPFKAALAVEDTTPPTVGNVYPNTAVAGVPVSVYATYRDSGVGVVYCELRDNNVAIWNSGLFPASGSGTATSRALSFSAGTHILEMRCMDQYENYGLSPRASLVVSADTTAPTVGNISPTTASGLTVFSASYLDNQTGVRACYIYEGEVEIWNTTSFSSTIEGVLSASLNLSTGTHVLQARCNDVAGNLGYGAISTVTVADSEAPVVGAVSPTVATLGATTFSASYSDNIGVTHCQLMDGGVQIWTSGTFAAKPTGIASVVMSLSAGTHNMDMRCYDAAGNVGGGTRQAVVIDGVAPTVGALSPTTAVAGSVSLTGSYTDATSGVVKCDLYEGTNQIFSGSTWATPSSSGSAGGVVNLTTGLHSLRMKCTDAAGNVGSGALTSVTVSAPTGDFTAPTVGIVFANVTEPTAGVIATYYVNATDNVGISQCRLLVDDIDVGVPMSFSSGSYSAVYQFPSNDKDVTHTVKASCSDAAGNYAISGVKNFKVIHNLQTPAAPTNLIKLRCGSYAPVEDPCHAVYYRDSKGSRHPFPNERVFMSWFTSYAGLTEMSLAEISAIPLGRSVYYRPGMVLVKFPSVPKVYELDRTGYFRWIVDEQTAIKLHGSGWAGYVVDESEAYYSQFRFGNDIQLNSVYSVADESNNALTIEQRVTSIY